MVCRNLPKCSEVGQPSPTLDGLATPPADSYRMRAHRFLILGLTLGCANPEATFLIHGGRLVDGSGAASQLTSVRVASGVITEIGTLEPNPGELVVDADGLVLAPGFIDTHSHHNRGLFDEPQALAVVSQGVTTIVVGQDGGSPHPLSAFLDRLEATPAAVNVASYSGHNTIRGRVMGDDFRRPATSAELDSMAALLETDLRAGALGISTGLEYDPGIYSTPEEVITLARVAAQFAGARYISHMRSEDRYFWEAVEEIIRIGREVSIPVQVSHMKLAMLSLWGETDRLIQRLDEARTNGIDITADVYPYEYWQSTMTVLFPERNFTDRAAATFALEELAPPDGIIISSFGPQREYIGMTVADIASQRGADAVTTYMDLVAEALAWEDSTGRGGEGIIARSMRMEDISALYRWPHTNVSSDGSLRGRHPRGFGSFPRVLAGMVRRDSVLTLEDAIHRMTGLAAHHMGFANRGVVRVGAPADLVLFDPDTIEDRATFDEPQTPAVGISRVWVNGVEVYDGTTVTGATPGQVLKRR